MKARKQTRNPARKGRAFPATSAAERQRTIEHLHSGAELSTRIINALDGVLRDAIDASEAQRAATALIVYAAFSRLNIEMGAVRLMASRLHNDAQGDAT
jgi:hypothetical protein